MLNGFGKLRRRWRDNSRERGENGVCKMNKPDPGFTLGPTGFLVTYANGYRLSVQWSPNHLCSLYAPGAPMVNYNPAAFRHSYSAECLEETPTGNGKLHAHCSPETVLKLMRKMERKQTDAERAMARQCRIENLKYRGKRYYVHPGPISGTWAVLDRGAGSPQDEHAIVHKSVTRRAARLIAARRNAGMPVEHDALDDKRHDDARSDGRPWDDADFGY